MKSDEFYTGLASVKDTWTVFYERVGRFLADPILVFEFMPNCSGLSYQVSEGGTRREFHRSPLLVRDRVGLAGCAEWSRWGYLFKDKFVVGVAQSWFVCTSQVWSPSIDATFMFEVLSQRISQGRNQTVLDYGCGTGVMGIALSRLFSSRSSISLVDCNPEALALAGMNAFANEVIPTITSHTLSGMPIHDIGIVTPYYFPVMTAPPEDPLRSIEQAATDSLEMVEHARRHARNVYFVFSSSTSSVFPGKAMFPYSEISRMSVPFSLGDNVSNMSVVNAAIEGRMFERRPNDQFPYWHDIVVAYTRGNDEGQ